MINISIVKMVEKITKRLQQPHISNSSNSEKSIKALLLSSNKLERLVNLSAGSGYNFLFSHLGSSMSISTEKVSFSPSKLAM